MGDYAIDYEAVPKKASLEDRLKKLFSSLRTIHIVLGVIELLVSIIMLILVYLAPTFPLTGYTGCYYLLLGTPGVFLPTVLSLGCVSPFLLTVIVLGLHGLLYHIVVIAVWRYKKYVRDLLNKKRQNIYRWIFRSAVEPVLLLVALDACGARETSMIIALMILGVIVEVMRWIAERNMLYYFNKNGTQIITHKERSSTFSAFLFGAVHVLIVLAYFIAFIIQDIASVPLITWFFGIVYILSTAIFLFWSHMTLSPDNAELDARRSTEIYWEIFRTIQLVLLAIAAMVGSIYY